MIQQENIIINVLSVGIHGSWSGIKMPRHYNRPYFQTKQYWGLVEFLKPIESSYELSYHDLVLAICDYLKKDNPKFKKELFLKALNAEDK